MTGRPSSFTQEVADLILERLPYADGGLEEVCQDDDLPSDRTVYRWLADPDREAFRQAYAQAREMCGDVQADRAVRDAIAAKDAGLGRLAFDARKWKASKLAPKKYGDKVALVGGGPDDAPVQFSDTQAAAKITALMEAARQRRDAEEG